MVALADDKKLVRSKEVAGKMQVLADRLEEARKAGKTWSESDEKEFNGLSSEYDQLRKEIEESRAADKVQDRMRQIDEDQKRSLRHGKPKPGLDDRIPGEDRSYGDAGYSREEARQYAQNELDKRNSLKAWLLASNAPHLITEEMRASCDRLHTSPNVNQLDVRLSDDRTFKSLQRRARTMHPSLVEEDVNNLEQRALSKINTPGSETVPQNWVAQVELAMIAYGPLLAYVSTLTTDHGQVINYPTGDDTANEGTVVAEATNIDTGVTQPDPSMSSIPLGAFEYISRFIKVPFTLSRDSAVNIDLLVANLIGERMGRIFTRHATTGTGSSQMQGLQVASATGATAASATAIAGDDLINLIHSVDPAYRANGTFLANDTVIAAVRKLKDTTGQYLWQSNLRDGLPDTILGRPVIYNPYMASTFASTNISFMYGDLSKYLFRRVGTGTLFRAQERFLEVLQSGYLFWNSADGRLLRGNATTANPVKRLTH
jgi:HK97 family phage major capsid protein